MQKAITIRVQGHEFERLIELAEQKNETVTTVVRQMVLIGLADHVAAERLAALEARILAAIQRVPAETANLLEPANA